MNARRGYRRDHCAVYETISKPIRCPQEYSAPKAACSRHAFRSSTFLQADPAANAHDPRPSFDPPAGCLVRGSTRVDTDEGAESMHRATAWVFWAIGIRVAMESWTAV